MFTCNKTLLFVGLALEVTIPNLASAASVLNTSPLWADASPSYHACNVANVSTTALRSVTVDLINQSGTVVETDTFPLAAGQSREVANFAGNINGFARCRFTVNGSAAKIRANITVFRSKSTDGGYFDVLGMESAR